MPHVRRRSRPPRGSALILVVIILAVLALLGAAALKLSEQESVNVSRQVSYQMLAACAEAAQRKLWAELALHGGAIPITSQPTVIPGPSGQQLRMSAGHFDEDPTPITQVAFKDNAMKKAPENAASGGLKDLDDSNTFRDGILANHYMIFAHCTDAKNRQYEVELMVKFGI